MLIPFGEILKKYKIEPKGIIHVGAHWAEELPDYCSYGIRNMVFIEPCKKAYYEMLGKNFPNIPPTEYTDGSEVVIKHNFGFFDEPLMGAVQFINCACGSEEKDMVMYVSHDNQGQSNSLLEPHLHLEQHKEVVFDDAEIVKVKLLDNVIDEIKYFNILAMDVQGYEGEVLKGATETLKHIDVVYTEVNRDSTYRGNMLIEEMDEYLKDFTRVETYWPSPNWSWGDACFVSNKILSSM